jgi:hypothetical protein
VGRGQGRWPLRSCSCCVVSSRSAARAESVMLSGRDAPGMAVGESVSSQARQTCCGLTPCSLAICWKMPRSEGAGAADAAERTPRQKRQAQLGTAAARPRWTGIRASTGSAPRPAGIRGGRRRGGSVAVGVGDPGRLDHALVNELGERAEGVGAVMLVETDRRAGSVRYRPGRSTAAGRRTGPGWSRRRRCRGTLTRTAATPPGSGRSTGWPGW